MAEPISIQQLKNASLDVKSLEEVVNGDENVVVLTRLGETYPSIKSVLENTISKFGFVIIDSFELGETLTQRNQALRHAATGKLYRWAGNLPKVVAAGSTPTSTGGTGTNAWLEVSDIALRQEILTGGLLTDTLITSTPKFLGSVARSLAEKNGDLISVKDFGAVGDGVTDDQPALQKAVDYMHSIGGGSLYLPRGKYIIKSGIKWQTKVSMYGEGMGVSILASVGDIFSAIYNLDAGNSNGSTLDANALEDVTFADFAVDCSGLTHELASVSGKAFFILYMRRARFLNIYVHDSIGTGIGCDFLEDTLMHGCVVERAGRNWAAGNNGGGQSGIGVGTGWLDYETLTISDCFVKDCGNYGIFVETQHGQTQPLFPTGCRVINCYAEGNRYNYGNKGSGGVMWIGCESNAARQSGFALSQNARGDSIDSCKIFNSGEYGIEMTYYAGNFSVRNCQIFNNGRDGVFIKSQGSGSAVTDYHISNCVIKDNGFNGVVIAGSGREIMYFSVTGCNIRDNGKAELSGNRLGISLLNTLSFGRITDNWIGNSDGNSSQVEPVKGSSSFTTINQLDIVNNTFYGHNSNAASIIGSNVRINNNVGHNDKAYSYTVSLSESPATYTASLADETLYLVGTGIRVDIAGTKIVEGVTQATVRVPANQSVVIRYTTMTMARMMY